MDFFGFSVTFVATDALSGVMVPARLSPIQFADINFRPAEAGRPRCASRQPSGTVMCQRSGSELVFVTSPLIRSCRRLIAWSWASWGSSDCVIVSDNSVRAP